ncbi:MAG: alkaline phosphatase family protein [Alphaproteobacteria bacterium]|nr:alkaline phosphatase family protein [Alphaproteobacteria bacterium]
MTDRPKNVLLIVVDQWRGDHLGRLGAAWAKTPRLDALATRGVTFARNFCQGAPCGPARTSLQTGKYVMNHRVVHNGVPLDSRHDHLARMLRRAGYDPALVGYSTTTPDPRGLAPNDQRFRTNGDIADSWRVITQMDEARTRTDVARNYVGWVASRAPHHAGRDADALWAPQSGARRPDGTACVVERDLSDSAWLTEAALEYLRGRPGDMPWMLHFGLYRPHPPFNAPAPFHASTPLEAIPPPVRAARRAEEAGGHPYLQHLYGSQDLGSYMSGGKGSVADLTDAELRHLRQAYCGLIEEADLQIGRVLDAVEAQGRMQDTLIVFTSDHGEQLGDHYLLGKLGFHDASYHVPLIIVDPSSAADATRGRIVRGMTESVDILPTILEWIGQPVPHTCDGRSLLPQIRGGADCTRDTVHFEFSLRGGFFAPSQRILGLDWRSCDLAVLRSDSHKYVHFQALPPVLFDLRADPGEIVDRSRDPAYREVMLDMAQRMLSWRMHHAERELVNLSASTDGLVAVA